jgi:predicted ATPase
VLSRFTHTFLALLALTLLINALIPVTQPLLDRMAITGGPGRGQSYTVIRALGSVGFAILTVAGGTRSCRTIIMGKRGPGVVWTGDVRAKEKGSRSTQARQISNKNKDNHSIQSTP